MQSNYVLFEEAAMVLNKIQDNLAYTAIKENVNLLYPHYSDNLKKVKVTQFEKNLFFNREDLCQEIQNSVL